VQRGTVIGRSADVQKLITILISMEQLIAEMSALLILPRLPKAAVVVACLRMTQMVMACSTASMFAPTTTTRRVASERVAVEYWKLTPMMMVPRIVWTYAQKTVPRSTLKSVDVQHLKPIPMQMAHLTATMCVQECQI
jgi:hypothetical protein